MTEGNTLLCPSSLGIEGTLLFGVIQNNTTVTLLETPLEVDNAFIEAAEKSGPLERRFRFANKCLKSGCRQWTGTKCGVIQMLNGDELMEVEHELKPCSIREQCRWYYEDGAKACTICNFVVTINLEENETLNISKRGSIQEN
jgi:hypothetical protein